MNKKTISTVIISSLMILSLAMVFPMASADDPPGNPHSIAGYVYDSDDNLVSINPEEDTIVIVIPGRGNQPGVLYASSTYLIDFDALEGEIGTFNFIIGGEPYTAVETKTITPGPPYDYILDLHIDFSEPTNNPPNAPSNPNPSHQATGVDNNKVLSWSCSDPDGDTLTYDVYFGDSTPPTLVSSDQSSSSYDPPGAMNYSGVYYWQITAKDDKGASTDGPEWNFTVEASEPPPPPGDPDPPSNPPPPSLPPEEDEEELVFNNPPTRPTVDGNTTGDADTNYTYTAVSTDPDGHNIS